MPKSSDNELNVRLGAGLSNGLFIKWGRFQMGAVGLPAMLTIAFAVSALLAGRLYGAW